MSFIDLPKFLQGYYLMTAIYVLNRVPSKTVPTTSYEIWHGKKLSLNHLIIWDCPAHVKRQQANKLEFRSFKARFIGYLKVIWILFLYSERPQYDCESKC